MVSKKKNSLFVWGWEKSVPRDHRLSSLASHVMPNGDPRDGFFYPTFTLMMDSNIILELKYLNDTCSPFST